MSDKSNEGKWNRGQSITRLRALNADIQDRLTALAESIKRQRRAGMRTLDEVTLKLIREVEQLGEQLHQEREWVRKSAKIPEEVLREIDRHGMPVWDERYWRHQLKEVPSTAELNDYLPKALERVLSLIDPKWLQEQARKPFRLDDEFRSKPLQLLGGVRLGTGSNGPQRLARMLLVAQDHLAQRDDLDFTSGALLIPELAMLGFRLDAIHELGPEARAKLARLPMLPDDEVASSIHELLVGAAAIAKGLSVEMLPSDPRTKTPDFKVHNQAVPVSLECKRRLRATEYEQREATYVMGLYEAMRGSLRKAGMHIAVEVDFSVPVQTVAAAEFTDLVTKIASFYEETSSEPPWGSVRCVPLEYVVDLSQATRLYAPNFLSRVFRWAEEQMDWDGLICEVEAPSTVRVKRGRDPLCLKWRTSHAEALRKKARGVTSLFGDAAKQIPDGDLGIIYIAYPEGARAVVADARTRAIMEEAQRWTLDFGKVIPLILVSRLYPRSLTVGVPDLIESTMALLAQEAHPGFPSLFPTAVFTFSPNQT